MGSMTDEALFLIVSISVFMVLAAAIATGCLLAKYDPQWLRDFLNY